MLYTTSVITLTLAGAAWAHGNHDAHSQAPIVDSKANWMVRHMAEEHHAADFDAASFFTLHDFDGDGQWEAAEIQRTYGLMDESNAHVKRGRKDELVAEIMRLADDDRDGLLSKMEFEVFVAGGGELPDFGFGPGHHGDDEYEYEIHHWEKYHDENTKLEDLTHPEDIEHFKKHEQMEEEEERMEELKRRSIVEENIPNKFRRP